MRHGSHVALVGDIYEAPGDPSAWDRVTVKLAHAFRSEFSQMIVFDTPDRLLWNFVNIRAAGEEWARDYATLDTAVQRVGRLTGPTPVTQFDLLTSDELRRCPVQQEFLPKHGVEHRIWIKARPRPGLTQLAALIRSSRQGPFTADECNSFGILRKHLQRAMGLHIELMEAHGLAATLEQGLDLLPAGLVLLDATGSVLFANRAARAILDAKRGIRVDGGRLAAMRSSEASRLHSLVARALAEAVGGGLAIERPECRPLMVRVVPVGRTTETLPLQAAAAVLLDDPDQSAACDPAALASLGLTPAESRLVAALVAGDTLEGYATRAGIRLHTARSVLKNVFAKTGTHRQTELAMLASRIAVGASI